MYNESTESIEVNNFIVDFLDLFSTSKTLNIQAITKICNLQLNTFAEINPDFDLINIMNNDRENRINKLKI